MALAPALEIVWERFSAESKDQPNVNQDFVYATAGCIRVLANEIDRLRAELIALGIKVTDFDDSVLN
jgi:hypothetical protein